MNKSTEQIADFSSYPFFREIEVFKEHLIALRILLPNFMKYSEEYLTEWNVHLNKFVNAKCTLVEEGEVKYYQVPIPLISEHDKIHRVINSLELSKSTLPTSYVVQVVSQFDAYLGKLIKIMLENKSELFNSLNKTIEFSKLMEFTSLEDAKEYVIEKEVETVLRDSHNEHFEYLEKKLGITLRDFDIYKEFIEITERRNLFVHTDSKVSSQYISNCEKFTIPLGSEVVRGYKLMADFSYSKRAIECFLEVGIKLGYVMWRKVFPNDGEKVDIIINQICFDLVKDEIYDVSANILEFMQSVNKKGRSDSTRLNMLFNLAQSYKWSARTDRFRSCINGIDVSASGANYKLAKSVLLEEYDEARKQVAKCEEEDVPQEAYLSWPIFKEFIKTPQFSEAYKAKYGENAELHSPATDSK